MKTFSLNTLTPMLRELDNIPFVNGGGCAIIAYSLAKYINKQAPRQARIVYLFQNWDDAYDNLKQGLPDSCAHAVVKVGDSYVDSTGIHTLKELIDNWHDCPRTITISQKLTLASINNKGWNPLFSRRTNVPTIQNILDVCLRQVTR